MRDRGRGHLAQTAGGGHGGARLRPRPLIAEHNFILATRETGYRGSIAAVAELVDNAIQAGAATVRVFITERRDRLEGQLRRELDVAVMDDGDGMEPGQLQTALQFGGSSRFANRSGLGRFGMGLPNSSVSQSRRLEVLSWQSPDHVLSTYLDIDEVASQNSRTIPAPRRAPLPNWARTHAGRTGTLVIWSRCDRLDYRKASTLQEKLVRPLGRMYRHLLWTGVRIFVNECPVTPIDPLFCQMVGVDGCAEQYGPELTYELRSRVSGQSSEVLVRFSELPIHAWADLPIQQKRDLGILRGAGISFVRAGREIDSGWKLFGDKRRENYDDWWRCELRFMPDLDEEFGVTHSKQGVAPSALLRETIGTDLGHIARQLNARVRSHFVALRGRVPSPAVTHAGLRDRGLSREGALGRLTYGMSGLTYAIRSKPLEIPSFFQARQENERLTVTLNTNHPFFERIFETAVACGNREHRYALESLLLAAARAQLDTDQESDCRVLGEFIEAWSDTLAAFLDV